MGKAPLPDEAQPASFSQWERIPSQIRQPFPFPTEGRKPFLPDKAAHLSLSLPQTKGREKKGGNKKGEPRGKLPLSSPLPIPALFSCRLGLGLGLGLGGLGLGFLLPLPALFFQVTTLVGCAP